MLLILHAAAGIFLLWQLKNLIQKIQPAIVHAQAGKAAELIARIKPF